MRENEIGTRVLEAAINVHRELGPGLLEMVYEFILARELSDHGLKVERQVPVPIIYKGIRFEEGFRADIIIEKKVLLGLKSIERISPAHKKQVQTYLRLTGLKLGYLLNFGERRSQNRYHSLREWAGRRASPAAIQGCGEILNKNLKALRLCGISIHSKQ